MNKIMQHTHTIITTHFLIGVEKCPNDGYCSDKRRLSLFLCVNEEKEEYVIIIYQPELTLKGTQLVS
jgi:hypothetical protein